MPVFRSFPRFLASVYAAPKAMLSRLKWTLDRHSDFLENIEGEDGVEIRKNYKGGITISAEGGGGGEAGGYYSYFKVIDASTSGTLKVGVVDGGDVGALNCGRAILNGAYSIWVPKFAKDLEGAGSYYVYLFGWIDETTGGGVEIVVNATGTVPTAPDVATPANMLAKGALLLGRVVVTEVESTLVMSTPNQDFLRGGEAVMMLGGECGADVVVDP